MNAVLNQNDTRVVALEGMTELVRGTDTQLVAALAPVVRDENIALDLNEVNRIDAAGIAALICLYGYAHEAGRTFHVCNVSHRVAEILTLVGLDHILVTDGPLAGSPCPSCETRTAA